MIHQEEDDGVDVDVDDEEDRESIARHCPSTHTHCELIKSICLFYVHLLACLIADTVILDFTVRHHSL